MAPGYRDAGPSLQMQLPYAMLFPAKLQVTANRHAHFFESAQDATTWLDQNEQALRYRRKEEESDWSGISTYPLRSMVLIRLELSISSVCHLLVKVFVLLGDSIWLSNLELFCDLRTNAHCFYKRKEQDAIFFLFWMWDMGACPVDGLVFILPTFPTMQASLGG